MGGVVGAVVVVVVVEVLVEGVGVLESSQAPPVARLAAHRSASVRSWLTSAWASRRVSVDTLSSTLAR